jgi:phosphoribosylformimino-5-aminoimidazole carboxamide ribotide isomerase
VVDLDGARAGEPVNLEHVRRITAAVQVPVQVGGGLRSIEAVEEAVRAGATRVILGTAAYRDLDLLDEAVARLGDRLVVSVDARDGRVAGEGWIDQTGIPIDSVIERLGGRGVGRFVYSSIDRDGMLAGPDFDGVRSVARVVRGTFLYSGGVSSLEDLRGLADLRQVNLAGVIVGKALYEQRFDVAEAQRVLDRRGP